MPSADPAPQAPHEDDAPSVFANSAVNLVTLVLANGLGALSGLLTARHLGAAGVGVLAVAFGLTEFGRSISNFTHNPSILEYHRGKAADMVFGTSLLLKLAGSSLFVLLAILLSPMLGALFQVPPLAIMLASLVLLAGVAFEIGSARFEADNRNLLRNVIIATGPTVGLAAVVILILTGRFDVYTAALTSTVGTLAMSVGFLLVWPGPWRLRYDGAIARYMTSYGSRIVLTTFLTQSLIWTDTLMLSWLKGTEPAGVYNVVFQLTFVMVTASIAIGVALVPAMSKLAGRGMDTSRAYQRGTLLALAISLVVSLAYLLAGKLFLGLYGDEFVSGYTTLLVLTVFGISAALAVPATSVLTVHNKAGTVTVLSLAQAFLNIPINYVLIQRHGTLGAAMATTSVFVLGTLVTWLLVKRHTGAWPLSRAVLAEAHLTAQTWKDRLFG